MMVIIVDPDGGVKVEFGPARSHPVPPPAFFGAEAREKDRPVIVVHEWEPPREVKE